MRDLRKSAFAVDAGDVIEIWLGGALPFKVRKSDNQILFDSSSNDDAF